MRCAVQLEPPYVPILVGGARRADAQEAIASEPHRDAGKAWTADHEAADAWDGREQADGSENEPGPHGSTVVVSRHSVWPIVEELEDAARDVLRAPRRAGERIFPRDPRFGLVSHERVLARRSGVQLGEVAIESRYRGRVSAHRVEQPAQVERHHPDVLRRAALAEPLLRGWMERGNRRTARVTRNDVAPRLGGEQVPPVLRAREIGLVLLRLAQRTGELRDGEIVGAVFERA